MMDGKWEDGQEINLKKFDDYYGDKAKIDAIHFQVIKDVETAYKEFQGRQPRCLRRSRCSDRRRQEGPRRVQGWLHHG